MQHVKFLFFFFTLLFLQCSLQAKNTNPEITFTTTSLEPPTEWMVNQIQHDFAPFQNHSLTQEEIDPFYQENAERLKLVKCTLLNNSLMEEHLFTDRGSTYRWESYEAAIHKILSLTSLPTMTFLISMRDGTDDESYSTQGMPIFTVSKYHLTKGILLPDFDALANRFQVVDGLEITQRDPPWELKKSCLIWRGSTAYAGIYQTEDNIEANHRITLCQLSLEQPTLINARFTVLAQGAEHLPSLTRYQGDFVSFYEQFFYKYHILIDGNALPYTNSGWKFFTGSLLFKPDSPWIQWYTFDLQPWVHYIPVERNLIDLLEKLNWALANDAEASKIARNAKNLGIERINEASNLTYLNAVLLRYHQLLKPKETKP